MTTITARPPRRTYRGRPGANEMLDLTTWTNKYGTGYVRVKGHFDVYCGMGGEHRRPVDVRDFADQFTGVEPDNVIDVIVADWLAYDYDGCPCYDGVDTP